MNASVLVAAVLAGAAAAVLPAPHRRPDADLARLERAARRRAGRRDLRPLAAAAAAAGGWVLVGGVLGVLLGLGAAAASWRVVGRLEPREERRRRELLAAGLPPAVDLLAATLRVGASPAAALDRVSRAVAPPVADELAVQVQRLRLGADPERVWVDLARHPQLGPLGRCLARATQSGSSVADAMHRLAEDLRAARRAGVEARARSVAVKAAAPLGLCLLPAFVLVGVVPLVAGSLSMLLSR